MSYKKKIDIKNLEQMNDFAEEIAQSYVHKRAEKLEEITKKRAFIIYLIGNLGAGKTTWTRAFLRGLGFSGKVKSPTFTLIEPYKIDDYNIYHLDLYRLKDPRELEYLGVEDYFQEAGSVVLIEWPEYGKGFLPAADLILNFDYGDEPDQRDVVCASEVMEIDS